MCRVSEVSGCAVLRKVSWTAQERLRHRVLNKNLNELEKQERTDRKELERKIEKLDRTRTELLVAKKTISMPKDAT